ncbi:autotransporter assembly complex protein TamA [Brackiella oedipodis]|uniref:autotransporter assembly complex protein TamA n=1 Tax=Brackiella oedipodis TaxID=124225 RepID=UPI000684B23C|nr:BamA/TamA family outer membrane protein [Brackiella oedipodis]
MLAKKSYLKLLLCLYLPSSLAWSDTVPTTTAKAESGASKNAVYADEVSPDPSAAKQARPKTSKSNLPKELAGVWPFNVVAPEEGGDSSIWQTSDGQDGDKGSAQIPEVIINPSGLSTQTLEVVNKGVQAVLRQIGDADADAREAFRIRRKGHDTIVTALQTQGYFDAKVKLEVGEDIGGETWDVSIQPGQQSKIRTVNNQFVGRISKSGYEQRLQGLRKDWKLPIGDGFVNKKWSDAKSDLITNVKAEDFYLARMMETHASVDPELSAVDLKTVVDSGPAVKLGNIEVLGLRRVPVSLIRRYIKYKPGDRFTQAQLDEWQQNLMNTNFFRGAFVSLRKPPGAEVYKQDEVELPINVYVTEAPARLFRAAAGIDDVNIVRVEGTYRQNIVAHKPFSLETGVSAGFKEQRAYLDFYLPPNYDGTVDSVGLVARHSDINDEEITRLGLGWRRKHEFKFDPQSNVEFESLWSVVAAMDRVDRDEVPTYTLPSVVATWNLLRRDVNDKFDPRSGNLEALDLGIGSDVRERKAFARVGFRAQVWFPLFKRDNFSLRGEIGYVKASDDTRLPDDFGYRVGGARTVRGYRYLSRGHESGDATVGARAMYVGSAEYTHYFNDMLGVAAFVDAGDAGDSFGQLLPVVGYGVGGRVKTPAGPIFLDIAYGQHEHSLRLHFSMGIAF